MLIKRTATWLFAWGGLVLLAAQAAAQIPSNSNLNYSDASPTYENASAPFAESSPRSGRGLLPFDPAPFEPDWDWFAPAETSTYGNGVRPNIGYFGSYERLFWSLSKPETAIVGSPSATGPGRFFPNGGFIQGVPTILTNTVDTGFLSALGAWGNRYDLGYWDTDNYGWLTSILDHVAQGQVDREQSVQIQFNDPGNLIHGQNGSVQILSLLPLLVQPVNFGKIPVRFDNFTMRNMTTLNGAELMRMYRTARLHNGGSFEMLWGVRWFQIDDSFLVNGSNFFAGFTPNTPSIGTFNSGTSTTGGTTASALVNFANPLSDSYWNTRAINNFVGPQIGTRLSRTRGRWTGSMEARFMAAANFQNVHQSFSLGNNVLPIDALIAIPANLWIPFYQGLGGNTHSFATRFSPLGEIRVQTVCQVTSNIGLKFGYTGIYVGNVTRASNRVDYSGPNLISIAGGGTHQTFFSNGINFGVEINR